MKTKILVLLGLSLLVFTIHSKAYADVLPSDLNQNSIPDSEEIEVVVDSNQYLDAGEYNFQSLKITNNATLLLKSDTTSLLSFKGVKINAESLTIEAGSNISANGEGYGGEGPGFTPTNTSSIVASSYGGKGGGNTYESLYGSALLPIDLGSGIDVNKKGGGALWLNISGIFENNGTVSSNAGGDRASGGSVYVQTNILSGFGDFTANGGNAFWPLGSNAGGGGRIAIYYNTSTFSGSAGASSGFYCFSGCDKGGGDGTVAFVDSTNNDLHIKNYFRFQTNDSPFNFQNIFIENGAVVETENGVEITSQNLTQENLSKFTLKNNPVLNISTINLNGNALLYFGDTSISLDIQNLNLNGFSTISTSENLVPITIEAQYIHIAQNASIFADKKGYCAFEGPGAPGGDSLSDISPFYAGASYGGLGGGNVPGSIYGDEHEPVDFGSGGSGGPSPIICGGGVVRIMADTLVHDGMISANGGDTSSGGSVYITAKNLSGNGYIEAKGGPQYCPNTCIYKYGGGGRIAVYYDASTFTGTISAVGGNNCASGCTSDDGTVVYEEKNTRDPVIIIPGITGSYLFKDYDDFGEVWPDITNLALSINDNFLNTLALDYLANSNNQIVVGDIVRGFPIIGSHVFDELIGELLANGYSENVDLFVFSYDWRFSNEESSIHLKNKIEQVLLQTGNTKVDIVAHSMGGLIAEKYIKKEGSNKIDQLIFVGTPHLGAPKAFKTLMFGDNMGIKILNSNTIKNISQNMPSVYELLPSQEYFNQNNAYVIDSRDRENSPKILNYNETKQVMLDSGRNKIMFPFAENLHSDIDNLDLSGMDVYNFVGCGVKTLGQINLKQKRTWRSSGYAWEDDIDIRYVNGDQTVPYYSADKTPGAGIYYVKNSTHGQLPSADGVRQDIAAILTGQTLPASTNILNNLDTCKISGKTVSTHSPVELHIYDEVGNHVGPKPDSDIEYNIPGVEYDILGEEKFAFLPDGADYKVVTKATDTGGYNFKIETSDLDDEITKTKNWSLIPLETMQATGEIWIGPDYPEDNYEVQMDQDGDGATDEAILPVEVDPSDVTPPDISISFNQDNREVVFGGVDTSPVMVQHSSAQTIVIDSVGNLSTLSYEKYKEKSTRTRLKFNTITRNGEVTTFPDTNVIYEWKEKNGELTDLDTLVKVKGEERYVFNYKKKQNVTVVHYREKGQKKQTVTTIPGFVSVTITTDGDEVKIDY